MAGYGVPEADIAGVIGVDPKTLRKHYRSELDHGHVKANARWRRTSIERPRETAVRLLSPPSSG
jgi:hypothetical protein